VVALAVYAVLLTLVSAWATFGGPGGPPLAKTVAEQRIIEAVEQVTSMSGPSSSTTDGRLLRLLAEAIGAENVVEIGTLNGHSGLWLCNALRKTGGKLTTFEIDPRRASNAREVFKRAGVDEIVTVVEGDAHVNVTKLEEPIDLVFIDADKDGYLDYLNKLLPLVRPGGLIVAHNMRFPPPDPEYIAAITTNPALETVFVNMAGAGIGVTLKKR
jgi:predicted O-methyltransferase YrrM